MLLVVILAKEDGGTNGREAEGGESEQAARRNGERVQQAGEGQTSGNQEVGGRVADEGQERGDEAVVYVED